MSRPAAYTRSLSARAVALLAVVVAAAWGPLAHSLSVVEVATRDSATTSRLVLRASSEQPKQIKSPNKAKDSKAPSERIFNALPDSLESVQAVHFDLDAVHTPALAMAAFVTSGIEPPVATDILHPFDPPDANPSRGPPVL